VCFLSGLFKFWSFQFDITLFVGFLNLDIISVFVVIGVVYYSVKLS
jgi:hypothetical protein